MYEKATNSIGSDDAPVGSEENEAAVSKPSISPAKCKH